MKKINTSILNSLSEEAANSARLRKNFNFHETSSDKIQRLLNAGEPKTYIQPHKHENPDKREVFIILRGRVLIVIFDDMGIITDHMILDPTIENFGIEIPERVWHTIIILEKGSILYEIKDGPYDINLDKTFAHWAPKEGDSDCLRYNSNILKQLKISL
jgi:cupin fold WbuC family metalloprotein